MNNIVKLSLFAFIAVGIFVALPNNTVLAWDTGGYGGGCCGGGGDGPSPDPSPEPPVVNVPAKCIALTASPNVLPQGGGDVTLTWQTSGAYFVNISGVGNNLARNGSTVVNVTQTTTFVMTVVPQFHDQNVTCSVKVTVQPPVTTPATCDSFTSNKSSLPYGGGNVTLTWATTNATSVSINNGVGTVSADGSKTVFVPSTRTFTLTAVGTGGNDTCTVTVTVQPPVTTPATCDSFTSNKSSLPYGGGNVTLTWATTNATSVSINNGVGTVSADGSKTVFVPSTRTFTLTAVGTGGNDTCTVTVTVQPPVTTPATCDSFTSNKSTLPYGGGNVTLTWATTNATSVSINNGVGTVSADGSKTVFVPSTRTFTLTAVGTGGNDTCTVTVTVQPPIDDVTPRCDYFNVSDSHVEEGDRVTLSWGTTNADRVTISPNVGDVADDGSTTVTVYDDTTYTLRARNLDNGQEVQCSVTVRVDEEEDDDREVPRCDLEVSDTRVSRGEKVTLSWETTNADSVRIRDDRGKTIFDTSDYSSSQRRRYLDGEIDVIVNQTTTFTLTARGDDGSKTCRVTVKTDDIAVYEKRDQGMVIALTQVPYTGFEAGPFLAFVFYAVLTLWALFVAYILVIKKSSILGFSLYKNSGLTETDLENRKKVEALVAKYTGKEWK